MRDIEKEIIDFIDQNITLKSTFSVGQSESSRLIPVLGMILNSFLKIVKNFYKSTSSVGM